MKYTWTKDCMSTYFNADHTLRIQKYRRFWWLEDMTTTGIGGKHRVIACKETFRDCKAFAEKHC